MYIWDLQKSDLWMRSIWLMNTHHDCLCSKSESLKSLPQFHYIFQWPFMMNHYDSTMGLDMHQKIGAWVTEEIAWKIKTISFLIFWKDTKIGRDLGVNFTQVLTTSYILIASATTLGTDWLKKFFEKSCFSFLP